MKILIVDDSGTVRQQLRRTLQTEGHEVVEACDGVDGLHLARTTSDFAVIICDVNMPRMNGIEMLGALRGDASAVPVLMLTTEGQPALIQEARSRGAKAWMVKPFKPELLVKLVDRLGELGARR